MQPHQASSTFERTINGFALSVAGIGALFLLPMINRHCREWVFDYIYEYMDAGFAYYGSWLFVFLLGISIFTAVSILIQTLIQGLFFRKPKKSHW